MRRDPGAPSALYFAGMATSELQDLYTRPGFLLRRAHQIAVGLFIEECARYGLTPPQHSALTVIERRPGIDQAALARTIGFDRATMGQVVEGLEKRGFVVREGSAADKRRKTLRLTAEGRALLRSARPAARRTTERLLAPLPAADRERFVKLLIELTGALNKASRTPMSEPTEG